MKSGYQLAQQDKKDKNTGIPYFMNNEGANKYCNADCLKQMRCQHQRKAEGEVSQR